MDAHGPVFGIVAGEASGDTLGASLIRSLRRRFPDAVFVGIAGPQMIAEGAESLFPMERLSVMGLVEVLGRLRELLHVRDELFARLSERKIDLFIGIDAPDFNLGLEGRFRESGVPTVHYVSPSVWAWRQGRVKKIARTTDLMLCLLPFEKQFYDAHEVKAVFVGHPLADSMPMQPDVAAARDSLGIASGQRVLAILPGSRGGEVTHIGPVMAESAAVFLKRHPDWVVAVPAINEARRQQISDIFAQKGVPVSLFDASRGPGVGRDVMAAADLVWLASGTATLEAMLLKKPMAVLYRFHWLTYLILSWLVRTPYVSLPNLLAGKMLVPELIQHEANPERLLTESESLMRPERKSSLLSEFVALHEVLRAGASETAADAIVELLGKRSSFARGHHGTT